MKTLKLFIATFIIFGLGLSSSFASNKLDDMSKEESSIKVAFLPQNLDQMVVSFETTGENIELSFFTENGKNIHTEAISGRGVFSKRYDLSELEKGVYSFHVKKGNNSLERTVVLK